MPSPLVLIFHPEPAVALALRRSLEPAGYTVVVLADAGALPTALRQLDPDAVLLPSWPDSAALRPLLHLVREDAPLARTCLLAASEDQERAAAVEGVFSAIAIAPDIDAATVRRVVQAAIADGGAEGSVLVVEDVALILEMTSDILHASRYRVLRAATAEEGIELALRAAPDMILLDIRLPGMDGVAAVRELKARPATAEIPIVMLSANGTEALIGEALEAGAVDFIVKPFSPRILVEKVAHVLLKRELLTHA
jgi:DNA-binding response OmpR family regulator